MVRAVLKYAHILTTIHLLEKATPFYPCHNKGHTKQAAIAELTGSSAPPKAIVFAIINTELNRKFMFKFMT